MIVRTLVLLAVSIAVASCVSMTSPIEVGPDRYLITLNARGGLQSDGDLLTQTVQQATAFCASKGRKINVESAQSSGTQGWTPQSNQIFFKCGAP